MSQTSEPTAVCPISLERIPAGKELVLDSVAYDCFSLLKYINTHSGRLRVPHSRRPFTAREIEAVFDMCGADNLPEKLDLRMLLDLTVDLLTG